MGWVPEGGGSEKGTTAAASRAPQCLLASWCLLGPSLRSFLSAHRCPTSAEVLPATHALNKISSLDGNEHSCKYIYIYIHRERERESNELQNHQISPSVFLSKSTAT